jgi:sulfite exporter TauE/SafE
MFGLGVFNGALPCGPVIAAALIAAAAPSVPATVLGMLLFGVGTLPSLVLVAVGAGQTSLLRWPHVQRLAGLLVILAGTQLGLRGLAATGAIGHQSIGRFVLY